MPARKKRKKAAGADDNGLARRQTGTLYTGDNLYFLHGMNSESVDLVYLDPPFNSKRLYKAPVGSRAAGTSFKDMWTWNDVDEAYLDQIVEQYPFLVQFIQATGVIHSEPMKAYLTYMAQRLLELHRVLKPAGSLYLHCDQTASHYLKIALDRIFGKHNFRNEIVWSYRTGGASRTRFARKHDVILFYAKQDGGTFNLQKEKAYTKSRSRRPGVVNYGGGQAEFFEDEAGVYNLVNMRDVWEISYIGSTHPERVGYPTQKPLELLRRIIEASSNEGDLVLDPFCGCATTCVAAQQLRRSWIGMDLSATTADLIMERLKTDDRLFTDFVRTGEFPKRTDIKEVEPTKNVKEKLYREQDGKCNACARDMEIFDLEIDHIIPKSKNGGDHYENYQLLCGHCNRLQGDRPMAYLMAKIAKRSAAMKFRVGFDSGKE